MEVVVQVPPDFNFDSNCSSPYITAPSSPQRFGNFFCSAPTSPSRASSSFFSDDNLRNSSSVIPFKWEEKPGIPKGATKIETEEEFEFDFSGQLDRDFLSAADELFDGGKIRPLKPPPRLQVSSNAGNDSGLASPKSPRSRISQGKKIVQEALSPKRRKENFDPFAAAIEETRKQEDRALRGRERSYSSSYVRKGTRSLSPMRVADVVFDPEENPESSEKIFPAKPPTSSTYSSILSAISFSNKKWKLKDLLLFRSASEGRATGKDPLTKYALLSKKTAEDIKNSSFRSTDSVGSVSSRRRGPVSAHEMHYTVNRAVSEEMRKKTMLPYKHGLLGCLGRFNPGVHEISRSFGSLSR
ncbi:hypothetical protein UlMin_043416 [Ulmus minor]